MTRKSSPIKTQGFSDQDPRKPIRILGVVRQLIKTKERVEDTPLSNRFGQMSHLKDNLSHKGIQPY